MAADERGVRAATGGLQIDEDLGFQQAEWRMQRIGAVALALFVIAAALGVFGSGPLARGTAEAPDATLRVEFARFVRVGAPTRITVRGSALSGDGSLELRIPRPYLEALRVERIVPEPAALELGARSAVLRFAPGTLPDRGYTILLDVEPLAVGRHEGAVAAGAGREVSYAQFAWF